MPVFDLYNFGSGCIVENIEIAEVRNATWRFPFFSAFANHALYAACSLPLTTR